MKESDFWFMALFFPVRMCFAEQTKKPFLRIFSDPCVSAWLAWWKNGKQSVNKHIIIIISF